MTTSVLRRSTCSITIFSNEVFPLPHAPYSPTVKEVGKVDCNITLARLSANDSRFSLSSEDLVMGRSGLIISITSVFYSAGLTMGSPYLCQLLQFYLDLCSILPRSSCLRLLPLYQYSPQFH